MLEFGVLGPLVVRADGEELDLGTSMQRRLLAILLCRPGHPMSTDALLEALWEENPPPTARKTLQIYVHRLRKILGSPHRISHQANGYMISVKPAELDYLRFVKLARLAQAALLAGDHAAEAEHLTAAVQLWRGPALVDIPECGYVAGWTGVWEEERLAVLDRYVLAQVEAGQPESAIAPLREAVGRHPYAEGLRGRLMLALHRSGRHADALAEYRSLRQLLVHDLGIEPGAKLQQLNLQILQADDVIQPNWPGAALPELNAPAQLPAGLDSFSGRMDALSQMERLAGARVGVIVIAGPAGVGKTTTAVHWAHQVRSHFPDGQLYVNLRGFDPSAETASPAEALRSFLLALGFRTEQIPTGLPDRTALFRSAVAGKRLLIVLDNARTAEQVRPLLPGTPSCRVIVTSRDRLLGLAVTEDARLINLELMTDSEALELLRNRIAGPRVSAEPQMVRELARLCAHLPLALSIVAVRANLNPDISLSSLAESLACQSSRLDELSGEDPRTDVRSVFSWSYAAVGKAAAQVFRLLGQHPGDAVSLDAVADLAELSLGETQDALTELADNHLVSRAAHLRYTMHDLLREYSRELAHSEETETARRAAKRRLVEHFLVTSRAAAMTIHPHRIDVEPPAGTCAPRAREFGDYDSAMEWLEQEFTTIESLVNLAVAATWDEQAWRLAWAIGDYAMRRSRWSEMLSIERTGLAAAQRVDDRSGQGLVRRFIGTALWFTGYPEDCLAEISLALEDFAEVDDHAGRTIALLDLAAFHEASPDRAAIYAQQALECSRQARYPAGEANALNALGYMNIVRGDHAIGLELCQSALRLLDDIGDLYGAAATWSSIGLAQLHLGQPGQAIASYLEALELYQHVGRPSYVGDTYLLLHRAYQAAGLIDEATASMRQAEATFAEIGIAPETIHARAEAQLSSSQLVEDDPGGHRGVQ